MSIAKQIYRSLVRARPLAGLIAAGATVSLLGCAALAVPAFATQYQRPLEGVLGPLAQPAFSSPEVLAVQPESGDVLVIENGSRTSIQRFDADGAPAPFAALGSNVLDGKAGPGGKPCAEEAASCDKTPQGYLQASSLTLTQIAFDDSSGPGQGDIYVTQQVSGGGVVDVFSSEGAYLGQLTAAGSAPISEACGVAVAPNGVVYVAGMFGVFGKKQIDGIAKYVSSAGPPVNEDNTATWGLNFNGESPCSLAAGSGASEGRLFASSPNSGRPYVIEVDESTGEAHVFSEALWGRIAVDPTDGNLVAQQLEPRAHWEAAEYPGSAETAGTPLSHLVVEPEGASDVNDIAFDSTGHMYVVYSHVGAVPTNALFYGLPAVVPGVTVTGAAQITGSRATLTGAVQPEGLEVESCDFEWGPVASDGSIAYEHTAPCVPASIPAGSGENPVHARIEGLTANGSSYGFRLVAGNENGRERSGAETFVTAYTVATEAATEVGLSDAVLHGTILPEGQEYSSCYFEWGVTGKAFTERTPCNPPAATIEPSFAPQPVSAQLSGLSQDTTYRFRLVAANREGTQTGQEAKLTTEGAPMISEVRASDAREGSVVLEAKIDPSGFPTSYHFQWGATDLYGNRVPTGFEPFAGSGNKPVRVSVTVSGLLAASTYHFRLVATNSANGASTSESEDALFETLDACGLADHRCLELVSPRWLGPVAAPGGRFSSGNELPFQVAPTGPGALAYSIEAGLPEASSGGEVLYLGQRDPGGGGWSSSQVGPPLLDLNERQTSSSSPSHVLGLSRDLSCSVIASNQDLTSDPSARIAIEGGGGNLYRRAAGGAYTLLTYLPPINQEEVPVRSNYESYKLVALSPTCDRVYFESDLHYPGLAGEGTWRLYEWHDGTLSEAAQVPSAGGGEAPSEILELFPQRPSFFNALSSDGSRFFFTAKRLSGTVPGETGAEGVFARIDGTHTIDISTSQTGTPDTGAQYQAATPDGQRVYFTANAGLTERSSPTGTDLYEYDFERPEGERLTDLSTFEQPGGAQVGGLVGIADDGSHVYFAAQAQMVPGEGNTRAQNESAPFGGDYSIYDYSHGAVRFVATVTEGNLGSSVAVSKIGSSGERHAIQLSWTSRVSPEGRYLLFESTANVTGYQSDEQLEAYLYDADAKHDAVVCVSCRQDGGAPFGTPLNARAGFGGPEPLEDSVSFVSQPYSLTMQEGAPRVIFLSDDRLATGAVEGRANLYEWAHGQVSFIAAEPAGETAKRESSEVNVAGASADGGDIYFFDAAALNWENPEGRNAAWDARVGGGFAQPPAPPTGCEATVEGSCQPAGAPASVLSAPGSVSFTGPENLAPAAPNDGQKSGEGQRKGKHVKRRGKHAKHRGRHARRKRGHPGHRGRHRQARRGHAGARGLAQRKGRSGR